MPPPSDLIDVLISGAERADRVAREEAEIEAAREAYIARLGRGRKPRSPFADEDPADRSPAKLSQGGLEGHARQIEDGAWQLVVMMPPPHPVGVVIPRAGHAGLPIEQTGDAVFDRRFAAIAGARVFALTDEVRDRWCGAGCDWTAAGGTFTATLKRFESRQHVLERLAHGLGLAEAFVAAQGASPAALVRVIRDGAWKVGAAALDALLSHSGSPELNEAFALILASGRDGARLRVFALGLARDWQGVLRELSDPDREVRAHAFAILHRHAPERLSDELLVAQVDGPQPAIEDAATELLAARGTGETYQALVKRGGPRALALAERLRVRLASGGLALAEHGEGGLALADGAADER